MPDPDDRISIHSLSLSLHIVAFPPHDSPASRFDPPLSIVLCLHRPPARTFYPCRRGLCTVTASFSRFRHLACGGRFPPCALSRGSEPSPLSPLFADQVPPAYPSSIPEIIKTGWDKPRFTATDPERSLRVRLLPLQKHPSYYLRTQQSRRKVLRFI